MARSGPMAEAFRTSELDRGRGLAGLFLGPWACVWGVCLGATRAATFLIICLTTGHFMGNSTVFRVLWWEGCEVEHSPVG